MNNSSHDLIQGVIFDLGNTLVRSKSVDVHRCMTRDLVNFVQRQFKDIDADTLIQRWETVLENFKKAGPFLPPSMEKTTETFLREILHEFGIDEPSDSFIAQAIEIYHMERIRTVRTFPAAYEVLKQLHDQKMKMGLVTNAKDTAKQRRVLDVLDLSKWFDPIIISADVGYRKPDSRIFRMVLDKWRLDPQQVVVVGDKLGRDILGAHRIGMRSVWIDNEDRRAENEELRDMILPDKTLSDIAELCYAIRQLAVEACVEDNNNPAQSPSSFSVFNVGYCFSSKKLEKFRKKQVLSHPYREDVSFVGIDLDQPLEEQGPFDLIMHKLTNAMSRLSPDDVRRLQALETYCSTHHDVIFVEPFNRIGICLSRLDISNFLTRTNLWLHSQMINDSFPKSAAHTHYPKWSLISNQEDIACFLSSLTQEGIDFPLICKPEQTSGPGAHKMLIVTHPAGFDNLLNISQPNQRWIVQEYINHSAVVFKVYVLGDWVGIGIRNSLPNFEHGFEASDSIFFDSQKPISPDLFDFSPSDEVSAAVEEYADEMASNMVEELQATQGSNHQGVLLQEERKSISDDDVALWASSFRLKDNDCAVEVNDIPVQIDQQYIKSVSQQIRAKLHLDIFGFDVIIQDFTNFYYIIDINYFPSYKEVPDFSVRLLNYLLQRHHSRPNGFAPKHYGD